MIWGHKAYQAVDWSLGAWINSVGFKLCVFVVGFCRIQTHVVLERSLCLQTLKLRSHYDFFRGAGR